MTHHGRVWIAVLVSSLVLASCTKKLVPVALKSGDAGQVMVIRSNSSPLFDEAIAGFSNNIDTAIQVLTLSPDTSAAAIDQVVHAAHAKLILCLGKQAAVAASE